MPAKKPTQSKKTKGEKNPSATKPLPKTQPSKKRSFNVYSGNTVAYMAVGILLLAVGVYAGSTYYHNKQIENSRIERLKQSGVALDKVKAALDKSGIDAQTKRLTYCWHIGEKYSEGQRYCAQRLIVYAKGKDVVRQQEELNNIATINNREFSTRTMKTVVVSKDSAVYPKYLSIGEESGIKYSCNAALFAYAPNFRDPEVAGGYVFDVRCEAPIDIAGDIYPPQGNVSGLNYLEEYQP